MIAYLEINPNTGIFTSAPSELHELDGTPVLKRTLKGLKSLDALSGIHVVFTDSPGEEILELVSEEAVTVHTITDEPDLPNRNTLRRARRWAIGNWRGGLRETTVFCEHGNPSLMKRVLEETETDRLLYVPRMSPFVPIETIQELSNRITNHSRQSFVAVPGPPGFHYMILQKELIGKLNRNNQHPGASLDIDYENYDPDPADRIPFLDLNRTARRCNLRFSCDFRRSRALTGKLVRKFGDEVLTEPVEEVARKARDVAHFWSHRIPREIEVLARSNANSSSTEIRREEWWDLLNQGIGTHRDVLLTVDTRYPDVSTNTIRNIMKAGTFSNFLDTHFAITENQLSQQLIDRLINGRPDTVSVQLDEDRIQSGDAQPESDTAETTALLDELLTERNREQLSVVVEMPKTVRTWYQEEELLLRWKDRADRFVIRGVSDDAGKTAERTTMALLPSNRDLCRKIRDTLVLTENGRVPICRPALSEDDFVGQFPDESLEEIWTLEPLEQLRQAHVSGHFDEYRLCPECTVWPVP